MFNFFKKDPKVDEARKKRLEKVLPGSIDPHFMKNRPNLGKSPHGDYELWGPLEPPTKLGIHGTAVAVDHDRCIADGACIDACEVNVFDWVASAGHPTAGKKSIPAREKDCLFCTACESVCPALAIKITHPDRISGVFIEDPRTRYSAPWAEKFKGAAVLGAYLSFVLFFPPKSLIGFLTAFVFGCFSLFLAWVPWRPILGGVSLEFGETDLKIENRKFRPIAIKRIARSEIITFESMKEIQPGSVEYFRVDLLLKDGKRMMLASNLSKDQADEMTNHLQSNGIKSL